MGGDITLEDAVFTKATPEQRRLAWELNGASWATPMSIPDYVERETTLSETALSRDGGCTYWILHRRDDPSDIISGCEVTRKEILIADAGGPRVATGYSIASVYTNPKYRAKGMAGMMLRRVQEWMDADSECSALYSDIGRSYYAGLGWPSFDSSQATLVHDASKATAPLRAPEGVEYLKEKDIEPLCARDVAALEKKFEALPRDGTTFVTFKPTFAQISWHFARDGFMARKLRDGREIVHRGARVPGRESWIYWDHDFREKKFKILRYVVEGEGGRAAEDLGLLLAAAVFEAHEWGLHKLLIWRPDEATSETIRSWNREDLSVVFNVREDGSIPSLRWKGGEATETEWLFNEYYSWC